MARKRSQPGQPAVRAKGRRTEPSQDSAAHVSDGNGYRIGISGWRYKPWRGTFYPEDLSQKRELLFASRHFNSIELNGSFYSSQSVASWKRWAAETPEGFLFSVKASRYITHLRRLKEIDAPLANFFAQGILALGKKLGPILWQFPPNFKFEADRFEAFLS